MTDIIDGEVVDMNSDVPVDQGLELDVSPTVKDVPRWEATAPMINGQTVDQVRFLDYGDIRVVFDSKTGAVLGTVPVKKGKKVNG